MAFQSLTGLHYKINVLNYICAAIMKKSFIQLHIAVFLAGFTAVLGELIKLNEGLLVWYRMLFAAIILGIVMMVRKEFKPQPFKQILRMAGVGSIIAFHWVTFYGSVKYGNISVALVCLSSAGFFSALLEPLILRRRIIPAELLLGLMAIAGIYIIFDFHPQFKLGIIYGLLAAFGSALFPIFNKQLIEKVNARELTFYEMAGGFVFLSVFLPLYLYYAHDVKYYIPTATDAGWLAVLVILCTVVCFDLQLKALEKISAFTCNLMYNLEPLYGIILAFIFFDEAKMFHGGFYAGVALILLAIVFQMVRISRQSKQQIKIAAPDVE